MPAIKAKKSKVKRALSRSTSTNHRYPRTRDELDARIAARDAGVIPSEEDRRACEEVAPAIEKALQDPNMKWHDGDELKWNLLGRILAEKRKAQGLSQAALARKAKLALSVLIRIESGKGATENAIRHLATVLDVDLRRYV